jgi:hypothetical protein
LRPVCDQAARLARERRAKGFSHGDEKDARARLRGEPAGVERQRPDLVAKAVEGGDKGAKVALAVGGQHADHVFEHDGARGAALGCERAHFLVEQPEGAAAGFHHVVGRAKS